MGDREGAIWRKGFEEERVVEYLKEVANKEPQPWQECRGKKKDADEQR